MTFFIHKNGLSDKEAKENIKKYGSNALTRQKRNSFFRQYLSSFADPIIKILLIALALNIIIAIKNSNIYEPLGIAIALFLATFVSTLSEYAGESAFIKLEAQFCGVSYRVKRGGKTVMLPIDDIAVGDTVIIGAGERVPADCLVIDGQVRVDMSALNGESAEVTRKKAAPPDKWDLSSPSLLFRGCEIMSGECVVSVGRVGDNTFYGSVAKEVQKSPPVSPLTKRLSRLASVIGIIGYIAAALVFFADMFCALAINMQPFSFSLVLHALTLAITVVVVAVPEGLPMMITVVLSSNMGRLKRDNVLVRKLVGIETAGCINMLFCDKTGTLTTGKLTVERIFDKNGEYTNLSDDMRICLGVNNESTLVGKKASGGNATDRALLEYVRNVPDVTVQSRVPFDSARKISAVKCGGKWYVKGAPENLFDKNNYNSLCNLHKDLTSQGFRVIAMAVGDSLESLVPLGIVVIRDRLRKDAKSAVTLLKQAGIGVCMVTGDNLLTAKTIACECGILTGDKKAIDSDMLSKLTDSELSDLIPNLAVVARALPSDKSRLIRVAREKGMVIAMTGDGINDAPALKSADVGFSMGSGTEVAKFAGDIIILDDSILSITKAVLYGRTIFKSIRKFIVFQLTINMCAVGISVIGPFIGIDTPVTVMQMLWINMIMVTLAGLAYAGESPDISYMKQKPIAKNAQVIDRCAASQIFCMGLYTLLLSVLFLWAEPFKNFFGFYTSERVFMTAFFALFVFSGLAAGVAARSPKGKNIFRGLSKNRAFTMIFLFISIVQILILYFGGRVFRTVFIPPRLLIYVVLLSTTVIAVDFLRKLFYKKEKK